MIDDSLNGNFHNFLDNPFRPFDCLNYFLLDDFLDWNLFLYYFFDNLFNWYFNDSVDKDLDWFFDNLLHYFLNRNLNKDLFFYRNLDNFFDDSFDGNFHEDFLYHRYFLNYLFFDNNFDWLLEDSINVPLDGHFNIFLDNFFYLYCGVDRDFHYFLDCHDSFHRDLDNLLDFLFDYPLHNTIDWYFDNLLNCYNFLDGHLDYLLHFPLYYLFHNSIDRNLNNLLNNLLYNLDILFSFLVFLLSSVGLLCSCFALSFNLPVCLDFPVVLPVFFGLPPVDLDLHGHLQNHDLLDLNLDLGLDHPNFLLGGCGLFLPEEG